MLSCKHLWVKTVWLDQTLGVECMACGLTLAYCWADEHVPESLWNRACKTSPTSKPCQENRDDVCAICEQECGVANGLNDAR